MKREVHAQETVVVEVTTTDDSDEPGARLLEALRVTEATATAMRHARIAHGVVVGVIVARNENEVFVDFPDNPLGPLPARSCALDPEYGPGHSVALMFESGAVDRPFVVGHMANPWRPAPPAEVAGDSTSEASHALAAATQHVIELAGDLEVRCGKASIRLTQDGRVELRGEYVLSRAEGTNRILGGAVRIN